MHLNGVEQTWNFEKVSELKKRYNTLCKSKKHITPVNPMKMLKNGKFYIYFLLQKKILQSDKFKVFFWNVSMQLTIHNVILTMIVLHVIFYGFCNLTVEWNLHIYCTLKR